MTLSNNEGNWDIFKTEDKNRPQDKKLPAALPLN